MKKSIEKQKWEENKKITRDSSKFIKIVPASEYADYVFQKELEKFKQKYGKNEK